MRFKYEIDEQLVVRVWDNENQNDDNKPVLLQEIHPDGRAWENQEEVKVWVEQLIAEWLLPAPEPEITEE
jgi:hypothetical protein